MSRQYRYECIVDDVDDPRVDEVRAKIRRMNEAQKEIEKDFPQYTRGSYWNQDLPRYWDNGQSEIRKRYYIRFRGRGSRTAPEKIQAWRDAYEQQYGKPYKWSDASIKYTLFQDLPVWMAEKVAVYIIERRTFHKPRYLIEREKERA